jgi:hypothetical protein
VLGHGGDVALGSGCVPCGGVALGGEVPLGSGLLLGAQVGDVLPVAGPVDVDAQGVHRQPIEDGHGDGGVAEVAPPVAQGDVGRHGGGDAAVPSVDQVEERMGGRGLVVALLDLAEADVVDDEQLGARPRLEAPGVGVVGEPCVEVVEQVDAAGVAQGDALLAGSQAKGLEDVALAGAALAGDDEVIAPAHEVEAGELEEEGLVERRLEVPVEGFERLLLAQAARRDAARDAPLELARDLGGEDVLEQRRGAGALACGPREQLVEALVDVRQSEEEEVSSESLEGEVCVVSGRVVSAAGSFSHGVSLSSQARAAPDVCGPPGRRS